MNHDYTTLSEWTVNGVLHCVVQDGDGDLYLMQYADGLNVAPLMLTIPASCVRRYAETLSRAEPPPIIDRRQTVIMINDGPMRVTGAAG